MPSFPYSGDVGTASYNNIITFCHKSGIDFVVSATTGGSHVAGSYHYKGNAVDVYTSAGNMVKLAQWLYKYAPYELELIHSGGSGYFVKNGAKVPASFYGAATVSQHYNHVHIAMTNSGITAAGGTGAGEKAAPNPLAGGTAPDTPPGPMGCLPALASLILIGATCGTAIAAIAQHWF